MKARKPEHLYRKNIIRAVKLAEVLYRTVPHPGREGTVRKVQTLPPPGAPPYQTTLPSGLVIQLVHYPNDTAALLLPQFNRGYWLTAMPASPPTLYLRDSMGNRCRDLFYDTATGMLGSRQGLQARGIYLYQSRDKTPAQRKARWEKIFRDQYPLVAPTILANPHNVKLALKNRPREMLYGVRKSYKQRHTWIAACERIWWGYVRPGGARKLQEQITASITEHLRKRPRWMKRIPGANFWRYLAPLNRRRRNLSIEPPLPLSSD
jgi:hypothetical protein